jgi:hypothetical protein
MRLCKRSILKELDIHLSDEAVRNIVDSHQHLLVLIYQAAQMSAMPSILLPCQDSGQRDAICSAISPQHEHTWPLGHRMSGRGSSLTDAVAVARPLLQDVDVHVERFAECVENREQSACIDIRNPAGDDDGVLVSGNEAPCQMLRQHVDILLQRADVWLANLDEPAPQCLERPDIANTSRRAGNCLSKNARCGESSKRA